VTVISELTPHKLESLLIQELGWSKSKVEELLLPIIQKIRKRTQVGYFYLFTCIHVVEIIF